jgi:ectoine hydroxylase-related dioxygenase (phytanoyl-CoA dioxygenase family)
VSVLEQLTAVRLHLDDCSGADGPLKVVPGSHMHGRVDGPAAARLRADAGEVACTLRAGGVVLLRPLTLHASSKAHGASRRRVLHIVFGPAALPFGLAWPAQARPGGNRVRMDGFA